MNALTFEFYDISKIKDFIEKIMFWFLIYQCLVLLDIHNQDFRRIHLYKSILFQRFLS